MALFGDHLGPRLGALVDGELSHDDRDRALAHIAGCAQCRALADAERSLKAQLDAMPMPEPSARLMAALFQIPQAHRPTQPPSNPPPSVGAGGFLGRSAAFLPEFAVGLRPLPDLPDDPPDEHGAAHRVRAVRGRGVLTGEASSFSRGLPTG
jgi:anti-sigma factor RsiW